jgi:hypothetical protein
MRNKQIMKEMYAQLGISSEVYDFGHEIEESLKERFDKFDKTAEGASCHAEEQGKRRMLRKFFWLRI